MTNIGKLKLLSFKPYVNYNGALISIENMKDIPFKIARIFYIYRLKRGQIRGKHAHRTCHQILICLQGECEVICDNGKKKKVFRLNKPKKGLYIPPMIWTRQKFMKDKTILLVLTNKNFNEHDYIRHYKEFLSLV